MEHDAGPNFPDSKNRSWNAPALDSQTLNYQPSTTKCSRIITPWKACPPWRVAEIIPESFRDFFGYKKR
jgi:hypothetical protein